MNAQEGEDNIELASKTAIHPTNNDFRLGVGSQQRSRLLSKASAASRLKAGSMISRNGHTGEDNLIILKLTY